MSYFSERERGERPREFEAIGEGAWGGIQALITSRVEDGSFGVTCPETGHDGAGPVGTDSTPLASAEVEVFIPISGAWSVFWSEEDAREAVVLGPMDRISVPGGVIRAFRNVGDAYAHLLVIIGSTENAAVTRPKAVVDAAKAAGVTLGADGRMVPAE